ncbi:MAG: hypothetical protein ACW96X_00325 [Promethearchaeota archaeon]|jgi:hypothetical protein
MSVESISQVHYHFRPEVKEFIDFIPEDRVFKFKYKLLRGNARRQLNSYLQRINFQRSMKQVYVYEINKLILNEALTSIIKIVNLKF